MIVVSPRKRRGGERIVPIACVGPLRHQTLDHGEIASPGRPMQRSAVVNADHVPVAVLLEQEVDGEALLADVGEEQRQADGVAFRHRLAVPPRARAQLPLAIKRRTQQVYPSPSGRRENIRFRAELEHLTGGTWRWL